MRRKCISIAAIILALAMLFSLSLIGCKVTSSETTAATETTQAVETTTAAETTQATKETKAGVTEVEFFHMFWVPDMLKVLENAIKAFEAENPDIKIKETRVSWTDAPSQLMTSIMGGQPPDLVLCGEAMAASLRSVNALADLTDMMSEEMKNSYLPAAKKVAVNEEGRWDGFPEEGCTYQLFYRKDLFEAAGLDPEKPPTTWDELIEYGKALTKDTNNDGNIDQWGYGWPVQGENANNYWIDYMMEAGSKVSIYDKEKKIWISQLNGDEALAGTKFMVDLVQTHKITPPGIVDMDWEAVTNGFVAGNFAMMYNGSWVIPPVHEKGPDIEGKWGTALMVAGPGGPDLRSRGLPDTFNILNASTKKEAAWKFLEFLYTAKPSPSGELSWLEELAKAGGTLIFTDKYIEWAKKNYEPLQLPFIEGVKYSFSCPMDPKWETFKALFVGKTVQGMLMGEIDVKSGLNSLHTNLEELHTMQ
ncbi:MAG: sugar ABC transporter substrate-binding protein [Cyanobacteria bacterium]|nr:sugar ABC transporter substrate-binding protein [Cyanobacteriota bacterium]